MAAAPDDPSSRNCATWSCLADTLERSTRSLGERAVCSAPYAGGTDQHHVTRRAQRAASDGVTHTQLRARAQPCHHTSAVPPHTQNNRAANPDRLE